MGLRGDRQERIRELGKVFSNPKTECDEIVDLYDWWSKHYDSVRMRFFIFLLIKSNWNRNFGHLKTDKYLWK